MASMRRTLAAVLAAVMAALVLLANVESFKLPAGFKRCSKADLRANNDCLRDAVQDAMPRLRDGLPKLGVPALDPMIIEHFSISQGGQGPVSVVLVFKDFTTTRVLDGIKINYAEVDLDKMVVKAEVQVPQAIVTSNYTVDGRVMVMPVKGAGGCRMELTEVTARFTITGRRVTNKKDGKVYCDFESATISLQPKKMRIQMDNLFNGDPVLGENMNRVINDNWEMLYSELSGSMNQAYGEVVKYYAIGVFRRVSIDDLFPDTLP